MAGSKVFWRGFGARLALAITFACASVQSSKAQTPSRSSPDASLTGAAQRGQQPQPQLRANHLDTTAVKPSSEGPCDGDLVATYTLPDLRDGLLTQSDPLVVEDGLDPTNAEHRPPSELANSPFQRACLHRRMVMRYFSKARKSGPSIPLSTGAPPDLRHWSHTTLPSLK